LRKKTERGTHWVAWLLAVLAIVVSADVTTRAWIGARVPGGWPDNDIPGDPGWHEIPDTKLAPNCPNPSPGGTTGCAAVISAWNGGIADTKRNRLILWGGGHGDYYGNEVYALDLVAKKMVRLTDPSPVDSVSTCPEAYPDGRPSSRHTYNGLAYIADMDKMFAFGGSKANCGFMSASTWTLDLRNLQWQSVIPRDRYAPTGAPGAVADYDPASGTIYLSDTAGFYRYDPSAQEYKRLATFHGVDYHLSGIAVPERRLFLMMGGPGQLWEVDLGPRSKHTPNDWSGRAHGCEKLLKAAYPGLAYDPVQGVVVGWAGGDSVILFDPARMSCTEKSFPGGPGTPQPNGTNGRFRYFPALGAFVLVNDWKQNAYSLRLTRAGATVH